MRKEAGKSFWAVMVAGAVGVAAGLAAPAHAYVPPSGFIVKSMAGKHRGVKGVRVRSLVSSFDATGSGPAARFKVVTVYNAETGVARSWASDEVGQALYALERKTASQPGLPSTVIALLFDANPVRVTEILRKQGIPVRTEPELLAMADEEERRSSEAVTLGRWKKAFAWILGGKALGGKTAEAQLWIEKDSFLPLRLITDLQAGGGPREALFENFRYYSEFPFPRLITWTEGNQALLREELADFLVNPPELKSFHQPLTSGYTDAGNAAPAPLRELLRKYFDTLR